MRGVKHINLFLHVMVIPGASIVDVDLKVEHPSVCFCFIVFHGIGGGLCVEKYKKSILLYLVNEDLEDLKIPVKSKCIGLKRVKRWLGIKS